MHKLDLQKVARAFGLSVPPMVNLGMSDLLNATTNTNKHAAVFSSTEGKVDKRASATFSER